MSFVNNQDYCCRYLLFYFSMALEDEHKVSVYMFLYFNNEREKNESLKTNYIPFLQNL